MRVRGRAEGWWSVPLIRQPGLFWPVSSMFLIVSILHFSVSVAAGLSAHVELVGWQKVVREPAPARADHVLVAAGCIPISTAHAWRARPGTHTRGSCMIIHSQHVPADGARLEGQRSAAAAVHGPNVQHHLRVHGMRQLFGREAQGMMCHGTPSGALKHHLRVHGCASC